jgi:hypothetical protein
METDIRTPESTQTPMRMILAKGSETANIKGITKIAPKATV